MDRRTWMYKASRISKEYIDGVAEFMRIAEEDMRKKGDNYLICPCVDCKNTKRQSPAEVRSHLIERGFKRKYTNWYWHGEDIGVTEASSTVPVSGRNVVTVDDVLDMDNENFENVDDQFFENVDDVPNMQTNEGEFVVNNELDELMRDVEPEFIDIPNFFQNMSADSRKPLFPNCTKYTKLSAVFKLFNLKAKNGWSDKSFTSLLKLDRKSVV